MLTRRAWIRELMEQAKQRLTEAGIVTMGDVRARAYAAGESPYGMLKSIIGEDMADLVMHELSLRECCYKLSTHPLEE